MKKTLFIFAMGAAMASIGQVQNDDSMKFSTGDKSFELHISPFADSPIKLNELKFRYFNSPNSAFRLSANIEHSSSNMVTQQEVDSLDQFELRDKSRSFTINLRPGYEYHFAGTKRLSPYIGGSLDLGLRKTSTSTDFQIGEDVINVKYIDGKTAGEGPTNKGYFAIGATAFAGFDYYVTKNIFIGTEFSLGIVQTNFLSAKVKSDAEDFEEPNPAKQGSATSISKGANGSIRIGILF